MEITELHDAIPERVYGKLEELGFTELRPAQYKAIEHGLFDDNNLLISTPTASGKTLVAEMAFLNAVYDDAGKAVYIVPLKALAQEKYADFTEDHPELDIAMTSGDVDSADTYLKSYDVIIATSEKFDSLLRHRASWIQDVKVLVVDEIHLLNDAQRGPTLEVVITLLQRMLARVQVVGLSATIGNPEEVAEWLDAELVEDEWRPVELRKGIYLDGDVEFYDA